VAFLQWGHSGAALVTVELAIESAVDVWGLPKTVLLA
jgi:hypothetical protein